MVFDLSENVIVMLLIGVFIWLSVITFFLFRITSHYQRITKGVHRAGLRDILEKMFTHQQKTEGLLKDLERTVVVLEEKEKLHIQKVGVARFNPFADTGGEQSFILALLDSENTGVVLSSLFSRSGMRWYIKNVINGKGTPHKLSEEEKKAIKHATVKRNYKNENNKNKK